MQCRRRSAPAASRDRTELPATVRVRLSLSGAARCRTCSLTDEPGGVNAASHRRRHDTGRFRWLDRRPDRKKDASRPWRLKSYTPSVTDDTVSAHDPKLQGLGDAALFEDRRVAAFQGFANRAARGLILLDSTETPGDLAALPGKRLEALRGDRAGRHSIRINAQWRVCFRWTDDGPHDVEIVDDR